MIVVCGGPRPNFRIDEPAEVPGTLYVSAFGQVFARAIPAGETVDFIATSDGTPIPADAELWFESAEERQH